MTRKLLTSSAVLLLTIGLLYSGVAWVLETCSLHGQHTDHTSFGDPYHAEVQPEHAHTSDESVPIIHCTSLLDQLLVSALGTSVSLIKQTKRFPVYAFPIPEATSPESKNHLWLEAIFKKILAFSSPIDSSRHLFLSVFRI